MESVRMDMQRMALNWRDEKYYFEDGNTTILVSKTLFKVHRSILAQDHSAFADMFAIGDDSIYVADEIDASQEGSNDSNPICLQGDTVDEFRDLLWSLYALPHEIVAVMTSRASIIKLANIARITNKYHFSNVEQWALRALTELYKDENPFSALGTIRRRPLPHVPAASVASTSGDSDSSSQSSVSVVGTESMSTHALVQTTEVAVLSGHEPLLRVVRGKWKKRIGERKDLAVAMDLFARLASSPHRHSSSALSSTSTLSVSTLESERQDLGDLQGLAYYTMMLQGREMWNRHPLLTREHRIKLLSGHHELTRLCEALEDDAPMFTHCEFATYSSGTPATNHTQDFTEDEACYDTDACQEAWKNLWKTITKPNSDFASLLGILYQSSSASSIRSADSSNSGLVGLAASSRDVSMNNSKADFLGKYMFAISVLQALVEGTISREGLMVYDLNEACLRRGLEASRMVLDRFRRGLMGFFGDVV